LSNSKLKSILETTENSIQFLENRVKEREKELLTEVENVFRNS
jgi:hypothetical protein